VGHAAAGADHTHDTPHTHGTAHAAAAVIHDEEDEDAHHHHGPVTPHESPWTMTVPLVVLAILSVAGGLIGVPYALSGGRIPNYFEHALEPVVAHAPERGGAAGHGAAPAATAPPATATATAGGGEHGVEMLSPAPQPHDGASPISVGEGQVGAPAHEAAHSPEEVAQERLFTLISVVIGLVGIALGILIFGKRPLLALPRFLENKYYVDEAYDAAVVNPIKNGSRSVLWRFFDVGVIDGFVNGVGRLTSQAGTLLRYLQPGFVRSYAAIILLGALAVVGYFAYSAYSVLRQMP
jgi:NADH-quinone oxidoreductase subunit L